MLWPIGLGLLVGGLIHQWVPQAFIERALSGNQKRVVIRAALLGVLASTCSHGCLAIAVQLYRKGASVAAVISFLLASPWANIALTLLILRFLGPAGLFIILAAYGVAVCVGLIFQRLERAGWVEQRLPITLPPAVAAAAPRAYAFWRPWGAVLREAYALGRMILGWILLGMVLSAAVAAWVPPAWIAHWFGGSGHGLLATLAAATAIEVCSEGSSFLAFELHQQTGALGNTFVFLMAGVVTDFTELSTLWGAIGKRTVFWLVGLSVPLIVLLGVAMNVLL
jgi:uncharacterized membrane protein YraQ (UPF0718 family)